MQSFFFFFSFWMYRWIFFIKLDIFLQIFFFLTFFLAPFLLAPITYMLVQLDGIDFWVSDHLIFFPLQYVLSHYINSMNPLTMPLSISITYCSKFSESPSIFAERMLVFMACPSTVNLLAYHMGKILDVASDKNATNSHYSHIMFSSLQTILIMLHILFDF